MNIRTLNVNPTTRALLEALEEQAIACPEPEGIAVQAVALAERPARCEECGWSGIAAECRSSLYGREGHGCPQCPEDATIFETAATSAAPAAAVAR